MKVTSGQTVALLLVSWLLVVTEATSGRKRRPAEKDASISGNGIEFSAFRHQPIKFSRHSHKPLLFERMECNEGEHYDLTNGYFVAPISGLYVFNFTTYVTMEKRLRLMKNDYEVRMVRKDGKNNRKKSTNQNILLQLNADDRVWIRAVYAKPRHNAANSTVTTFSGKFITEDVYIDDSRQPSTRHKRSVNPSLQRVIRQSSLAPVSLVPMKSVMRESTPRDVTTTTQKIAFSVTCTKSMIGARMVDTTRTLDGPMSPEAAPNGRIRFDKVFVNIGNGFDLERAEFRAPTSGVYYFSYNVGKFPKKKLSVMLIKNFNEIQSLVYNDSPGKAREMQSQSLMLDLKKGDTVWLRSYNGDGYAVYSNLGNYIIFNGYLVFAL